MSASPAPNETRLPRAVLRRSQDLREKYGQGKRPDPAAPSGAPAVDTPPLDDADPSAALPAPPVAAPSPPAPTEVDLLKKEVLRLEQANRSVSGRLQAVAEERRVERADWQQKLTELQGQIQTLQAKQPPAEIDLGKHFTPEQVEALGETQCKAFIATAQRIAQQSIDEAVEAAVKPLRDKQAASEQSAEEIAQQRYFIRLAELVPEWETINASDAWKDWLAHEIDEGSGVIRDEVLKRHHDARDADKVATVFKKFIAQTTPVPSPELPAPPVAPRGNGAKPNGDPPPGSVLQPHGRPSPKEIAAFYKRCAVKKPGEVGYVTDAERAAFEARLKS